ncbi:MAG TPA: hypothetical protein VMX97_07840 [Hyphomicrobiaceae bacterium]|nr:hypothetical protein [Hyphomicrobiaceae bacterium]
MLGSETPAAETAILFRCYSKAGHEHINMLGRYTFALPDQVARGKLRPLRDPKDL